MWVLAFTVIAATAVSPAAGRESSTAARFTPDEPLTSYRAFRRMHAKSEKFNQEGWLNAWTEFDGRQFRYQIVDERGSDYVRNKVLKGLLKREQEIVAEGPARAALTEENYVFGETGAEADGERYIQITPKRKDVMLVEGRMVLTSDGNDLLRVEGRLAKNPSFWTSLVNVIRHFAKVDGVRVPVATESVAKVKFAGPVAARRGLRVRVDQRAAGQRRGEAAACLEQRRNATVVALSEQPVGIRQQKARPPLSDEVGQTDLRPLRDIDRQRLFQQLLELGPILRRCGHARRQRDVGERRLAAGQRHRTIEVLAGPRRRPADQRRQPFYRNHRLVDGAVAPAFVQRERPSQQRAHQGDFADRARADCGARDSSPPRPRRPRTTPGRPLEWSIRATAVHGAGSLLERVTKCGVSGPELADAVAVAPGHTSGPPDRGARPTRCAFERGEHLALDLQEGVGVLRETVAAGQQQPGVRRAGSRASSRPS